MIVIKWVCLGISLDKRRCNVRHKFFLRDHERTRSISMQREKDKYIYYDIWYVRLTGMYMRTNVYMRKVYKSMESSGRA